MLTAPGHHKYTNQPPLKKKYQPTAELAPGGQVDHVSRAPLFLAAAFFPLPFLFFYYIYSPPCPPPLLLAKQIGKYIIGCL